MKLENSKHTRTHTAQAHARWQCREVVKLFEHIISDLARIVRSPKYFAEWFKLCLWNAKFNSKHFLCGLRRILFSFVSTATFGIFVVREQFIGRFVSRWQSFTWICVFALGRRWINSHRRKEAKWKKKITANRNVRKIIQMCKTHFLFRWRNASMREICARHSNGARDTEIFAVQIVLTFRRSEAMQRRHFVQHNKRFPLIKVNSGENCGIWKMKVCVERISRRLSILCRILFDHDS